MCLALHPGSRQCSWKATVLTCLPFPSNSPAPQTFEVDLEVAKMSVSCQQCEKEPDDCCTCMAVALGSRP